MDLHLQSPPCADPGVPLSLLGPVGCERSHPGALNRGDRDGYSKNSGVFEREAEQLFHPQEGAGKSLPAASGSTIPAGMSQQGMAFTRSSASLPAWASELTPGSLAEGEGGSICYSILPPPFRWIN